MSVTFSTDKTSSHIECSCCLCAQMAPGWCYPGLPDDLAVLREHADPACQFCGGAGVQVAKRANDGDEVNFANDNARLVLESLGFDELLGSTELHTFRRACMRALAGEIRACRQPLEIRGQARAESDRIVRGPQVVVAGVTESGVRERIERLLAFAARMAARGATVIYWS